MKDRFVSVNLDFIKSLRRRVVGLDDDEWRNSSEFNVGEKHIPSGSLIIGEKRAFKYSNKASRSALLDHYAEFGGFPVANIDGESTVPIPGEFIEGVGDESYIEATDIYPAQGDK